MIGYYFGSWHIHVIYLWCCVYELKKIGVLKTVLVIF